MRALILCFLFIVSALGANITSIICPDELNDEGIFELTLYISGDFNASFEQKDDGSITTLIFGGLKSDKIFTKTLDTKMIKNVSIKPIANATKISFESKQLFDISVSSAPNKLHIAVIPKAAPLMIEDIAKDTAGGQIGYILETLLLIALVLFAFVMPFILYLKSKLSLHVKKDDEKLQSKEGVPPFGPKADEKLSAQNEKIEKAVEIIHPKHPKTPKKHPKNRQKTLFDI
ncbi:MAG: hypothetical protein LBF13_00805 [Campylobacteraceae bacterium]|nr:hypothetical protein [Campylobacteraceae bacterium]